MESFRAYRIFEENGRSKGRLVDMSTEELDAGEVLIRTAYSSVNFKDALTGTGVGKVVRRFPCVGGIDGCGTVVSSSDARFKAGDEVICTSYDLGVAHDGGYAGMMRVRADWVVPLPAGLTLFESMALGTAGYTSALAIHLLEHNGMEPANGKVVVNGATGGCASLAISMLANLGYKVSAVTGKAAEHDYLKSIGAAEVLGREAIADCDGIVNRAHHHGEPVGHRGARGVGGGKGLELRSQRVVDRICQLVSHARKHRQRRRDRREIVRRRLARAVHAGVYPPRRRAAGLLRRALRAQQDAVGGADTRA